MIYQIQGSYIDWNFSCPNASLEGIKYKKMMHLNWSVSCCRFIYANVHLNGTCNKLYLKTSISGSIQISIKLAYLKFSTHPLIFTPFPCSGHLASSNRLVAVAFILHSLHLITHRLMACCFALEGFIKIVFFSTQGKNKWIYPFL